MKKISVILIITLLPSLVFGNAGQFKKLRPEQIPSVVVADTLTPRDLQGKQLLAWADTFVNGLKDGNLSRTAMAAQTGAFFLNSSNAQLQMTGDYILEAVRKSVEENLRNGKIGIDDEEIAPIVTILKNNCFTVAYSLSDLQKIKLNVELGNWSYLYERLKCRSGKYLWAILIFVLTIVILIISQKIKTLTLNLKPMKTHLVLIILMLSASSIAAQNLSQSYQGSSFGGNVEVKKLYLDGNYAGQSYTLNRRGVYATYFANNAYSSFMALKGRRKVIAAMSAAYTTGSNYSQPFGLTIEKGMVINRALDETLDALVIVQNTGGIVVYSLDAGKNLKLFDQNGATLVDPRNPVDKQILIDWAISQQATIFQTNLLVYKGIKKFGHVAQNAERRLLAVCEKLGNVYHIVFNIEKKVSLTAIAEQIANMLAADNFYVVGLINLDTGMYNCFTAMDDRGGEICKGTTELYQAKNLLVWYSE